MVQPSCWSGHELTATLRTVCLGAGWNTLMHTQLAHFCIITHSNICFSCTLSLSHTHTHSCIHQVQKSTQYLGGYSREGGALRDAFGYLQSFYPQSSEHQLLLGRTQKGFLRGLWGDVRPEDERAKGKHTDTWAEGGNKRCCSLFICSINHTILTKVQLRYKDTQNENGKFQM